MSKWLLAVLLALLLSFAGSGEEIGFGLGGPMLGLITHLDLTALNAELSAAGYPTLPGHMLVTGGGGVGGVTKGPAFGGIGFGGTTDAIAGRRSASLELSFGGMTIERLERAAEGVLVGVGAVLGGGSLQLTVRARDPEDLSDALEDPTTVYLDRGFFGGMVHLRMQIQLLEWLSLDGWAGYLIGFPGRWQDDGREIAGGQVDIGAPFFAVRLGFGGMGPTPADGWPEIDRRELDRLPDVTPDPDPQPDPEDED